MNAIGKRGRYIENWADKDNKYGEVQVETARWTVDGPTKLHEFRFIERVRVTLGTALLVVVRLIDHLIDGKRVGQLEWGHGQTEAYASSQTWTDHGSELTADLVAVRIFKNDLPCCGGKFVLDREHHELATLEYGHCDKCRQKWLVADGRSFRKQK